MEPVARAEHLAESCRRSEADFDPRLRGFPWVPERFRAGALDRDPRLRRVARWLRSSAAGPVRLEEAAREACLTRCYFSAYFRRSTGVGFRDWLTLVRVQAAARQLAESRRSVAEIAWDAGYRDLRTFGRAFRRITGTTPTRYRRRASAYRRSTRIEPPEVCR